MNDDLSTSILVKYSFLVKGIFTAVILVQYDKISRFFLQSFYVSKSSCSFSFFYYASVSKMIIHIIHVLIEGIQKRIKSFFNIPM